MRKLICNQRRIDTTFPCLNTKPTKSKIYNANGHYDVHNNLFINCLVCCDVLNWKNQTDAFIRISREANGSSRYNAKWNFWYTRFFFSQFYKSIDKYCSYCNCNHHICKNMKLCINLNFSDQNKEEKYDKLSSEKPVNVYVITPGLFRNFMQICLDKINESDNKSHLRRGHGEIYKQFTSETIACLT